MSHRPVRSSARRNMARRRPRDWLSVYANYAEGFGPNDSYTAYPNKPVAPSDARQWEVGAKTEIFDGRLRATAAYFELTKTNVPTSDPAHPGFSIVTGEVLSKGPIPCLR
jgi:iron complex outermembrane receptor protein